MHHLSAATTRDETGGGFTPKMDGNHTLQKFHGSVEEVYCARQLLAINVNGCNGSIVGGGPQSVIALTTMIGNVLPFWCYAPPTKS